MRAEERTSRLWGTDANVLVIGRGTDVDADGRTDGWMNNRFVSGW